jgi:hypothetical protein
LTNSLIPLKKNLKNKKEQGVQRKKKIRKPMKMMMKTWKLKKLPVVHSLIKKKKMEKLYFIKQSLLRKMKKKML